MIPLIKQLASSASEQSVKCNNIVAVMESLAATTNQTTSDLFENATHILSNIAVNAREGKPLTIMHPNSIASFMAGIEAISHSLPTSTDAIKRDNTLRVLAAAAIDRDGLVNYAATPIAQLGAQKPDSLKKYQRLVQNYVMSVEHGAPDGKGLAHIADVLKQLIDQAMRRSANKA